MFLIFHRCFTFGIGSGVSTSLVRGLAQAGNGTAEFIQSGERLQPKVGGGAMGMVTLVMSNDLVVI